MFSESYQWLTSPVCVTAVLIAIVLAAAWIKSFFKKQYNATHKSICIILGSGGHTMEMMEILKDIDCQHFSPRHYIIASTDQTSEGKVILHEQQIQSQTGKNQIYTISKISRSRQVNQPWISSIFSTLWAAWFSLMIFYRLYPDLILCNGPGTCVPIACIARLTQLLGISRARVMYVESLARVSDLSLSGKILYNIVDKFIIQWPQLKTKYPKSIYVGRLV
ncbi:hypothetical protein BDEG_23083 [Batrachochytrium dendrobatidis JEL423]|uniref:UDP-N-acetylglucosamine transferase subunit ALG14 n=2 Tax=Batrachochytrium dendrobatidis TaxID=109871 RepID=A0A177WI90_BATDL|nr:hypothetical protein BDEG_23083 [Batrachochytrium dendrobatidis JEL423]